MPLLSLALTDAGLRRVSGAEDGPVLVTSAVLDELGGGRHPVPVSPGPDPASRGRIGVVFGPPPADCRVTGANLLAEDGTAIFRAEGDVLLRAGDSLTIFLALEALARVLACPTLTSTAPAAPWDAGQRCT